MTGLSSQLGVHTDTLWRANRALAASGLVRVEPGRGRTWTRYTLDVVEITRLLGELPGSPWGAMPVHPGENTTPESPQTAGTDPANCGDRPRDLRGQTPQNHVPYAHVRAYVREVDPSKNTPPYPREQPAGPAGDDSPPASGQGPLSDQEKCEHGRTVAQGGCRTCGTTRRAGDQQRAATEKAERKAAQIAAQLAERDAAAAARAAAQPPDPELLAQTRNTIRTHNRRTP